MLEAIKAPKDLEGLSQEELTALAAEIRQRILKTVSKNGGHLASNLGLVETTLALHLAFHGPEDRIIFDVSHQAYTHKLITGRADRFDTLRTYGGLSGFTARGESEHDTFTEGHSGASLSAALGLAEANHRRGSEGYVVDVVGDGSLTNGMIYEAMNNCDGRDLNLILVINDNEMSISRNVGGLHRYLSRIRVSRGYFSFKRGFERFLSAIPLVGRGLASFLKRVKDGVKRMFVKNNVFEDLGLIYLGPVDGHDPEHLALVLAEAKTKHRPCVVHVVTQKGRGYAPAEAEPGKYHSVGPFDPEVGISASRGDDFSSRAGACLCELAERDPRVCAITAAMCDGTGLGDFARRFPDRFYDVGIAEEHAITFASGLSAGGMRPVVALYSTFAQRVYDQLLHDVALQRLPMVLLLDRAGLVPGDGATHQGVFDYALFASVPGITVYAPETYAELEQTMALALAEDHLTVIRYPKGKETVTESSCTDAESMLTYSEGVEEAEAVIVTYGRMASVAAEAAALLSSEHKVGWIKAVRVYPTPHGAVDRLTARAKVVYYVEEGISSGGFAEKMAARRTPTGARVVIHAVEDFVPHGTVAELNESCGFTPAKVASRLREALDSDKE